MAAAIHPVRPRVAHIFFCLCTHAIHSRRSFFNSNTLGGRILPTRYQRRACGHERACCFQPEPPEVRLYVATHAMHRCKQGDLLVNGSHIAAHTSRPTAPDPAQRATCNARLATHAATGKRPATNDHQQPHASQPTSPPAHQSTSPPSHHPAPSHRQTATGHAPGLLAHFLGRTGHKLAGEALKYKLFVFESREIEKRRYSPRAGAPA